MENTIIIKQSEDSPEIIMDLEKKELSIEGPSFPEDAVEIYKPIIIWLSENEEKLNGLIVSFDYSILSSASNKMVFEVLVKLENMYKKGIKLKVRWNYASFDEDMFDEGRGFRDNLKMPFELIKK